MVYPGAPGGHEDRPRSQVFRVQRSEFVTGPEDPLVPLGLRSAVLSTVSVEVPRPDLLRVQPLDGQRDPDGSSLYLTVLYLCPRVDLDQSSEVFTGSRRSEGVQRRETETRPSCGPSTRAGLLRVCPYRYGGCLCLCVRTVSLAHRGGDTYVRQGRLPRSYSSLSVRFDRGPVFCCCGLLDV